MAQPVLYMIPSFDAAVGANINFAYDGEQVFANELVIIDNETSAQVYDIKMSDWMRMYHTVGVDSGLVNGKYYACKVRVFDKSGNASDWSSWRSFYCFTTPTFSISNLTDGQVLQVSEYTFNFVYSQEQNEPLNMYNVMLYNSGRVLLSKSENQYGTDKMSYTVRQMEDATQYYIRIVGDTLNGMTVDSGYVGFSVKYVTPTYWTYVDLTNNEEDGSVRISCNIRSITGSHEGGGDPTYIDDKMIDLRGDDKVIFNDGYVQSGDFTMKMLGRDFVQKEALFIMDDHDGTTVSLYYREGWFSPDSLIAEGHEVTDSVLGCWLGYFQLEAVSAGGMMVYTAHSDGLDLPLGDGQEYFITLRRISDVYSIDATIISQTEYAQE